MTFMSFIAFLQRPHDGAFHETSQLAMSPSGIGPIEAVQHNVGDTPGLKDRVT